MKVLSKIIVYVLMLCIFSGCKNDEEFSPPGWKATYYYITVSNAAGGDLLNPDNQSNVINGLSLDINGEKARIYTIDDEDARAGLYGFLEASDEDCWALAVGPFMYYKSDKKIELKINEKKYIIEIKVRIEAVEEGSGQFIYDDIYLNGELLEFMKAPVIIPITI